MTYVVLRIDILNKITDMEMTVWCGGHGRTPATTESWIHGVKQSINIVPR